MSKNKLWAIINNKQLKIIAVPPQEIPPGSTLFNGNVNIFRDLNIAGELNLQNTIQTKRLRLGDNIILSSPESSFLINNTQSNCDIIDIRQLNNCVFKITDDGTIVNNPTINNINYQI
jgi:hypothetical protein